MKQTLSVLIVDDEFHIRSGILHSIPWSDLDMHVVGEAEDGHQAISMLEAHHPDLVLLDINIPGPDGLEIARTIRRYHGDTQIIFLTGYDDFQKVKEAVTLQASDYLLKPVAYSELLQALQKAAARVLTARKLQGDVDRLKEQVHRYKDAAADQVLLDVLQQRRSFEDAADSLAEAGIVGGPDRLYGFLCTDIDRYEQQIGHVSERDRQLYLYAYRKLAQEVLAQEIRTIPGAADLYISGHVLHVSVSKLLLLLQIRKPAREAGDHPEERFLTHVAKRLQEAYRLYLRLSVSIGLSTHGLGSDKLHDGYKEALQAVDYRAMLGHGSIIPARLLDGTMGRSPKSLSKELYVLGELRAGSDIRSNGMVGEWLEELRGMPLSEAKMFAAQFAGYAFRLYEHTDAGSASAIHVPLDQIADCDTSQALTGILAEFLFSLADCIRGTRSQPAMRTIEDAKAWIREHLHEDISLNMLASALHLNPYYVSRLFKQTTDETFLEFTTRIRFERARELLAGTTLKMHEIAEQIGFNDANYFSIAFKKHQGISPTDYRKRFLSTS